MMKILLLSDPNSSHTIKWQKGLEHNGLIVKVWGFNYSKIKIFQIFDVIKVIKSFKPDIIHAHYASSYGLIGALCGFRPFILSVWGSDVFSFPKKNFLNQMIIRYNFLKADKILSTSNIMAVEAQLYTNKEIVITPFGVNCRVFKPTYNENEVITIGIIKSLKKIYAIDYAIRAFNEVLKRLEKQKIKMLIIGNGEQEEELNRLALELNISEYIEFVGKVNYENIAYYHNKIDIFINISLHESFGVSVLESSSCEKPVIVSNVGGLTEVVENNKTGILVPVKDYVKTADAIEKLFKDKELRLKMGKAGRKMVKNKYNWKNNVNQMINIYKEILS